MTHTERTTSLYHWEKPPQNLVLLEDEVHVWRASLEAPPIRIAGLKRLLSEDEVGRANKYYFKEDRRSFIVARGLLRTILGRYLSMKPSRLAFEYGRRGKPELAQQYKGTGLRFNLSHTDSIVLYAITRNREVGIDIENKNRAVDMELIIRRKCSEHEKSDFRAVPDQLKQQSFFNCWTRKEAFIKARGEGLATRLEQITVSLLPGEPARLMETSQGEQEAARWTLKEVNVVAGYIAAVIAQGQNWTLRSWDWSW